MWLAWIDKDRPAFSKSNAKWADKSKKALGELIAYGLSCGAAR
jgi:hypothetical protein